MNTKALIAEFIGTFALIFVGVGAIAADPGLTGIALAHGLTIAVMVSATAAVSGGHLNPAVTFGALLGGKIDPASAAGYVVAQCLGGVAGAAVLLVCLPDGSAAVAAGTPALAPSVSPMMAIVMEAVLTFFLVFVVYGTAIDKRAPKVGGLFIGLTVALDILIGGPVTGAAMNPARHLGPAVFATEHLSQIWIYWIGPLLGGALAGLVYHNLLEEK